MCAPTTAQHAAIEAMENGDDDVVEMRGQYDLRRRYIVQRLRDMGLSCFEPEGAFYVFVDISRFGMEDGEFCTRMIREAKVATVPGSCFGSPGFLRISYCCSDEDLKKGLDRMEAFIKTL